jgi:hypothetical protein
VLRDFAVTELLLISKSHAFFSFKHTRLHVDTPGFACLLDSVLAYVLADIAELQDLDEGLKLLDVALGQRSPVWVGVFSSGLHISCLESLVYTSTLF